MESGAAIGKTYTQFWFFIIGVDIGSSKAVLAVVRKGGIDIILSDSSSK
jgi:hypothetical protein